MASVIILVLNQLEHTRKCLESLAVHTTLPHEVIIVDNGSSDLTPTFLAEWQSSHSNCRVIRNTTNQGFAAGNNQGLAIARGEYVVLLNNDTVVNPGWLEGLRDHFVRHANAGIVGPMSNYVVGPQLVTNPGYTSLDQLPEFASNWRNSFEGQSQEVNRVIGFCLMASRPVLETIGGLDPAFGSGNFEDDDFCIRARGAGFRIFIARDVFIHHTGSQTFKGAHVDYEQAMLRNWGIFKRKWNLRSDATLQSGYSHATLSVDGVALKVPLPDLSRTHSASSDGLRWIPGAAATSAAGRALALPACSLVGQFESSPVSSGGIDLSAVWATTCSSLKQRPFHPEACLRLAEIAHAAGDYATARLCAERARKLAPKWKPARKFLNRCPKGGKRPDWLTLPESLEPGECKGQKLSVCLIAKNEEKFLAQCLQSIKEVAHQIVVVDTGSSDRTAEIAKEHGAEVYHFEWRDDFSAARNAALEHVTGDWVLILDADEELSPEGREKLKQHVANSEVMAWRLPLINKNREDIGVSYVPRLFRNAPGLYFKGRVHEQIFPMVDVFRYKFGLDNRLGEALLIHHGYDEQVMRDKNKIERNLRLLELAIQEQPGEPNLLMNLGLELTRSGREAEGLERYREAYRVMSALPPSGLLPELKQTFLIQFCSRLHATKLLEEVVEVLKSPLAIMHGGLTASDHFSLGIAYCELKQYREAAEQMRHCVAKRHQPTLTPINQSIHTAGPFHFMGIALAKLGEIEKAEEAFQQGLKETTGVERVRSDYANFLLEQKRPIEALQQLHAIIQAQPENRAAWCMGGQVALTQPEFLEFACDWTGEALKHFPEDPVIQSLRAEALLLSGQTGPSSELLKKVLELQRHPRTLAALVLCEMLGGHSDCRPLDSAESKAASKAFLDWYRRCLACNLAPIITGLNARMDVLRQALPEAAEILSSALTEAARPDEPAQPDPDEPCFAK